MRLREERARLGVSQAQMARDLGITREALRLFENGKNVPGGGVLADMATRGYDVQFVLIGTAHKVSEEPERYSHCQDDVDEISTQAVAVAKLLAMLLETIEDLRKRRHVADVVIHAIKEGAKK